MAGAGLSLTVTIDDREVREALGRLAKAAHDLSPAMKNIGEYLVQATEQRFDTETGPDGQKWAEVSPATRARKKHPKVLTESHRLRNSFQPHAGRDSVIVGTNVPYAAAHQFGFAGQVSIPAHDRLIKAAFGQPLKHPVRARIKPYTMQQNIQSRPFLGLNEEDKQEILGIIEDHIAMALK